MIGKMIPPHIGSWIKENPDRSGIHLLRFVFALLWISQGLSKLLIRDDDMYKDNNEFLNELYWMKETNPISPIVSLLKDVIIPNIDFFLVIVVLTELFIGLSLGFGLFTRLGSAVGGLMTITLWILTLGWDEWIWTYPLIFFPHVLFFLSHLGKEIGVDRILSEKEKLKDNKFINLLM